MTPESFDAVAHVLRDALMLVSPDGRILGINQHGLQAIGASDKRSVLGRHLAEMVTDPQSNVDALIRAVRRTSDETIGVLRFNGDSSSQRITACRVSSPGDTYSLLLRIEPFELAIQQFTVLNEKVEQLNREIYKRKVVENQLRVERDVAAFGRDIGIALVHPQALPDALHRCTDLMVDRLGAAFARIWIANEKRTELRLAASSGMYTHLDGSHSCIRFGEYKIGRIAASQVPHITNHVVGDHQIHDQGWAEREGMVAFVGYPLIDDDLTVGVMGIFAREELSEAVAAALASVSNSIALRIRKQSSEEGLAKQTLALQEADRRKDEFLAMLSHELRNPLAPVRSGLDLLALEDIGHEDTIELMQQQVEHLVRLVDDLLDVSRIMRGKVELRKEPVEVGPLVFHARDTLNETIKSAGHELAISIPNEPVWIDADSVRVVQVIENLLKNACKYTDRGGKIELSLCKVDQQALLSVKDNGIGIDSELLPQLFDLFTQSERTLDRSQGGLGIGLTLSRSLVEMHGGTITVTSGGLGAGSEFSVRLPLCEAPSPQSKSISQSFATPASCMRILAVDDNRAAHTMLSRLFQRLGDHEVVTADDGPSGIDAFARFHPDLVLLDIGLPGMDGYEVAASMRKMRPDDSYLLVALTGYGQKEDRRKSLQAGFDEHLVKPPSFDQLRGLLAHPRLKLASNR